MYKDKQREANAERQRRYKEKHKGVTSEGVTDKALPERYVSESGSESGFDDETSPEPERTAQGNIEIETLAKMDIGCGDKLKHGLKRGKAVKALDREYHKTIDQAILEALGCNSLNSKDLRGACAKVPKPPRRAGLM